MNFNNSNGFLSNIPSVTKNILIINVLVWLACYLFGDIVSYYLALHGVDNRRFLIGDELGFYPYQLITFMFTHQSLSHLFFNMFAVFMFGSTLENYWGSKRYIIYYMLTGVGSGLIQLLVCALQGAPSLTIGASGAVFGLLLAFGMTFPNTPLFLMFIPIPIKAKYMVIGYGVLEFFAGVANRSGDNVAHFAHLGGMLFGFFLILYWKKKSRANYGGYF